MNNPLVSIVIPVYNGSNYLKDAIDSALSQTYKNIEIIVVNDGSNDNGETEKIALSYNNKVRYFYKDNGGVASAVNLAIKNMKGEYFAWLSHDDIYYPEKIEKQILAIMKTGDRTAIVHSNFDVLYTDLNRKFKHDFLNEYKEQRLINSNFAPIFLAIHGCSILIHKSHFKRVGLYDESLISTQDSVFLFKVMRNIKSIFIKDSLFMARIHSDQGSNTLSCHEKEYNEMFVYFCEELSKDEKKKMCGTEYNFYYRLHEKLLRSPKANGILSYLEKKMEKTCKDRNLTKIYFEEKLFNNKNNIGKKELCLFGAGNFGQIAYKELKNRNINIKYFIDNNTDKIGTYIYDIKCISFDEFYTNKENKVILISMKDSESIEKQLKKLDIEYIKWIDFNELLFRF